MTMAKTLSADVMMGRKVITEGVFGAVRKGTAGEAGKFAVEVPIGTPGTVVGRHPSPNLPGWWLVDVVVGEEHYDMPLTEYQVEVQTVDPRK